jgi:uncharacterized protein (TIGR03000 family)
MLLVLFCCISPLSFLASRLVLASRPARAPEPPTPTAASNAPAAAHAAKTPATAAIEARATVVVHVPAEAELWLEGSKGKQTGEIRRFRTPPLEAGRNYSYEVRARWRAEGKVVDQTREVAVCGGETTVVDFTHSESAFGP